MSRNRFRSEESYKKYKEKERKRYYYDSGVYGRSCRRWTDEEDAFVRDTYKMNLHVVSGYLSRSVKAVESRRHLLKERGYIDTKRDEGVVQLG